MNIHFSRLKAFASVHKQARRLLVVSLQYFSIDRYLIGTAFFSYVYSPLVRDFLSIDNPRNASVHDEDENETNGMNHENSESLVSSLYIYKKITIYKNVHISTIGVMWFKVDFQLASLI